MTESDHVVHSFLAQLFTRIPENPPGDNHKIDLLGALKDVIDLGVAHPFFQEIFARIAERTEQFDRFLGDLCDCETGFRLGHRRFQAIV